LASACSELVVGARGLGVLMEALPDLNPTASPRATAFTRV